MSTTVDAPSTGAPSTSTSVPEFPPTARLLGRFRRDLIAQGFSEDQAYELVRIALTDTFAPNGLVIETDGEAA